MQFVSPEDLSMSAALVQPRARQWSHENLTDYDQDGDWTFYSVERHDLPERRESVVLVCSSAGPTHVRWDGHLYELHDWETYAEAVSVWDESLGEWVASQHALTQDEFEELSQLDLILEGPMMNYWYPLNSEDSIGSYRDRLSPERAAARLDDLSLCLVQVDADYGLALTGGGMDLSWDIIAGYVRLGYLPPVHFTPPGFRRFSREEEEYLLECCKTTLRKLSKQLEYKLSRLNEYTIEDN